MQRPREESKILHYWQFDNDRNIQWGAIKGDAEMRIGSEYRDLLIQKFSLTAM